MIRFSIVLFAILFFTFQKASAQDPIEWSEEIRSPLGNNSYTKMLGVVDDNYFLLHARNQKQIISKFTHNHEKVSEKEFTYFGKNEDYGFIEIIKTPTDTFLYMHELLNKHKEWVLHIARYKDGNFLDPEEIYFEAHKEISVARLRNSFEGIRSNDAVEGKLIMSSDSSHIAFVNTIYKTDYRQKEIVSAIVFDSAMKELWRASFNHEFTREVFELENVRVLNNGTIKFLGKIQTKLRTSGKVISIREKKLPRYRYSLYNMDQYGITDQSIELDKKNAIVQAGIFQASNEKENFKVAGFYSNGEKQDRINGIFCSQSNSELELTQISTHEMKKEIWKDLTFDFKINQMIEFDNGNFGFLAENNFVTSSVSYDNFNTFNRGYRVNGLNNNIREYFYNSDEILFPVFSKDGTLKKLNILYKQYRSNSPVGGSYYFTKSNSASYLVFNDVKSNKEKKALDLKGRVFTDLVIINSEGDIESQETISTDRETRYNYSPHLTGFENGYLITGFFINGRVEFGKINLK